MKATVEWAKNVRVGYLDQHTVLEKGMTIRDVLKPLPFTYLFDMEARHESKSVEKMGEASPEELEQYTGRDLGTIQELLDHA